MDPGNKKVSVIIPTYCRPNLLSRAIDSVLKQSYDNIEIIVIDDNVPDSIFRKETEILMANYLRNKCVKYIQNSKNETSAIARNNGIKAATGDLISFLDDDDFYLAQKIEVMVNVLELNKDFAGAYCGWRRGTKVFNPQRNDNLIQDLLLGTDFIYTPTTLFNREAIISIQGWNENIQRHQDSEFIVRLLASGQKLIPVYDDLVVIDESDRSQVPQGYKWEKNTRLFLEIMDEHINKIETNTTGFKKKVYCNRYLSVMLNYLKYNFYFQALKIYIILTIKYPLGFNITLLKYLNKRFKTIK